MLTDITGWFFAISLVFAAATPSLADIGVVVLEPVDALGFFTRVGHVGTYFSNICPDGSPVKMRLCTPGERGSVVSKYSPLSENEDFDWAIVPFEQYLHGFESPELAPMIGTRGLQHAIERHNFGPLFSSALSPTRPGEVPDGQWKAALATRFDRTIYVYTVKTTVEEDATIVQAFNCAPNKARFNFFYRNCSNQTKSIFDLLVGNVESIGDRTGGLTMETPKGLAKKLVSHGLQRPDLQLRARRYPQIPGRFGRSRDVLFPLENMYKSIGFAPWWFFEGYRVVALGAIVYHQVITPFGMLQSSRDFMSPAVAQLTIEQHRLRQRQDEIRHALASIGVDGSRRSRLWELDGRVVRRLAEIRRERQAEVSRVAGSKAQWRRLDREFRSMVRPLGERLRVPDALKRDLAQSERIGALWGHLLQYFDAHGTFYVDETGRGPWLSLPLVDGETATTGLSRTHVLTGDPRLAALILAAVIDYNLHQSEARREEIAYVEEMVALLKRASDTIGQERQ